MPILIAVTIQAVLLMVWFNAPGLDRAPWWMMLSPALVLVLSLFLALVLTGFGAVSMIRSVRR